ncbi:MAG: MFS transporter [Anaerolineae bacterium]|nr:MFS transporter [Anaerolineae bacterium]
MRAFSIVWAGQFVSIFGTTMTQFALTIWSWKFLTEIQPVDNPATAMALVGFFNFAPQILFSPIAGALVDRWNRKLVMMLSDLAAGIATIALFLLFITNNLQIWHLYVAGAFTGLFQTFQWPAYSASISLMIPKEKYERANAMLSLAESVPQIFGPIAAGVLLAVVGIGGVMVIDIVSFLAAIGTLIFVHIPQPEASKEGAEGKGSLWRESIFGFRYIFQRPSLLGLQMVFFFGNLLSSLGFALFAPMILARTNNDSLALGSVQSALGAGAVVGGLILATRGGLKRRVHGVLGGWLFSTIFGSIIMGLGRALPIWVVTGFISSWIMVYINASNQAIWQAKVAPDVQGRVFSARRMIAQIVGPVGILVAGPLADRVFEPGMREGGNLAPIFGGLVGVGPGAGMALLLVITGVLTVLVSGGAYFIPVIRNAEDILPDHDAKPKNDELEEKPKRVEEIPMESSAAI